MIVDFWKLAVSWTASSVDSHRNNPHSMLGTLLSWSRFDVQLPFYLCHRKEGIAVPLYHLLGC
jgi:hypothetical protein